MQFDSALSIISGWVGQAVSVVVVDIASDTNLVHLEGTLQVPSEMFDAASPDELLIFPVGDGAQTHVTLGQPAFNGADGDAKHLELRFGNSLLRMTPLE